MPTISDIVVDGTDNPISRVVRLYRQDSGEFVAQVVSDPVTGAYSFTIGNTDKHFAIAHDNINAVDSFWSSVVFMLELPATDNGASFPEKTGNTVTRAGTGAVTKTGTTKYGPASVYLPGTGYLRCDAVSATLVGATEFTIDGWFNAASDFTGQDVLFGFHTSSGANRAVVADLQMFGDNFTTATYPSLVVASPGEWVHVAFELYNGVYRVYQDGVIFASATATEANTITATDLFTIGQEFDSGPTSSDYFNGYVDNRFRVTKAARYKGVAFSPDTTLAPTNLITDTNKNAIIFDELVPV